MLTNDLSKPDLMELFISIQAKVKTAAICCETLHDQTDPGKVSEGIYATSIQLGEAYNQMDVIQSQMSVMLAKAVG